jgi:hypothetical protein
VTRGRDAHAPAGEDARAPNAPHPTTLIAPHPPLPPAPAPFIISGMTHFPGERAHDKNNCWCECAAEDHYFFEGFFKRASVLSMPIEWRPGLACHKCEKTLADHLRNSRMMAIHRAQGHELTEEELILMVKIGISETNGSAN